MISLTTLIADPINTVLFRPDPESGLSARTRRVTRTPTLDGGAALFDGGASEADRTFVIIWTASQAEAIKAEALVKLYSRIRVATDDGVYIAAPQSLTRDRSGSYTLTLLVIERESA